MASIRQITPGRVRVLVGACFRGMNVHTLSKAAIVEGKNIDAEFVQGPQLRQCVREGANAVVQHQQSIRGVECVGISGNPPTVELKDSGLRGVKSDLIKLQSGRRWCERDGARGLENQLPLPLPEEQAEGEVDA